ncbi:hypothetical protein ABB37_00012 [Leptomonas pyrrhocoris]|uniref:Uncharacterized protein n=1 Tax=Leptomonas pyrrhocoris TaxID=157538 RepID=A0A0M9G9J6_LEPPY|nr:hypothetical protein ABB37_00012 [Leptomonas pyrrhocoris]KPA85603.1 hypothetical protein ABB37_00012 [Leptomonas pyrrhocoris]|eukprot:XP_015664042.1 hypothetical protein ABB37_00012 [Leptomonas pyrrhocoris]
MPHQQTITQQVQEAVSQGSAAAAAQVGEKAQQAREKAAELLESATNGADNLHQTATNAKKNVQEAAKKAMDTAHDYVEDARKKADPYVESTKAKYESAKAAAGNYRETAQHAMENAKGQVNAVREKVTQRAQPYVDNVQAFDITKTATFHVLTHLLSIYLYVVWRILRLVPAANKVGTFVEEKEKNIGVIAGCAAAGQKVPVVGPRTVEVITIAAKSVRIDLNEQIAQYEANSKKQK